MVADIGEPIKVGAIFEPPDGIRPAWFIWQGRRHIVREVTYTWGHREGICRVQNFAVSDGLSLYHIAYNREGMNWLLVAIEDDG